MLDMYQLEHDANHLTRKITLDRKANGTWFEKKTWIKQAAIVPASGGYDKNLVCW